MRWVVPAILVLLGMSLSISIDRIAAAAPAAPMSSTALTSSDVPGDGLEQLARRQWERLGVEDVLDLAGDIYRETGEYLPPLTWETVRGVIRGEGLPISSGDLLTALGRALFGAIIDNMGLLGKLVLLAVMLSVLHLLQSAFEGETVASVAYTVIYLAMAIVSLLAFYEAVQIARGTVDSLVNFMHALLPLMVTLLAGVGAFVSAGLLSPLVVMLVNGVGAVAANWVLPLLFLGTVLDVADHLPGRVRVTRLAAFIRQAGMLTLAISFTVFLGITAVQGVAGSVADGVALRTAKYTAGTFIPVLGGMFADAAELVLGSSMVLKNAVGLVGTAAVVLIALFPLLKVLALILIFRLAAALIQPVAQGPFVNALATMGDGLVQIGLVTGAVVLMFFLMLTVVLGVGNVTMMWR